MIKFFITCFFTFITTSSFSQTSSLYMTKALSYTEYSETVGTFLIKLKRNPYFKLGGNKSDFKKCSMFQLKIEIVEHQKKYPDSVVVITTAKRAKYQNFVEILNFLSKNKVKKYVLMDES